MSEFQFTPLREGRRKAVNDVVPGIIFQFTPLREGRLEYNSELETDCDFNSRPCVRGDLKVSDVDSVELDISIHAPA